MTLQLIKTVMKQVILNMVRVNGYFGMNDPSKIFFYIMLYNMYTYYIYYIIIISCYLKNIKLL